MPEHLIQIWLKSASLFLRYLNCKGFKYADIDVSGIHTKNSVTVPLPQSEKTRIYFNQKIECYSGPNCKKNGLWESGKTHF